MGLTKQEIRDRLITVSKWVTPTHTELAETAGIVRERMLRYVVQIHLNGNQQKKVGVEISTLNEGGTPGTVAQHTVRFSHINVAPADNVKLQESLNLEDSILTMEGGTRGPYARCLTAGHSLNVTAQYWENDI